MEPAVPRRRQQKILLVDDNADNLILLRALLAMRGYDVTTVSSAEEARELLSRQGFDLILLDVVLPGASGFELCREIKSDPATRLVPVVLITGLTQPEDRVQGIDAGADDFLNKPIFAEELYARVRSLLKLKEFTDELENAESVLFALALGVEARDPYTGDHCERLAHYAVELGKHLQLDDESLTALKRGGYLHDIGKISVPDEILKKGSNLSPEEWRIMRQHPVTGENICKPLRSFRAVLPIIRYHHEHVNGSGYPDGLRDGAIPLLARVLQVVDVYDALRTARPYKPALSHEMSQQTMIKQAKDGLLDPELVAEFFRMLATERRAA
jgi:putative two-component system response regulator